jgi:hypothetical protein
VNGLCDISVGGEDALEHRTAGKADYFHPEYRLLLIYDARNHIAAAFDAILPQLFHSAFSNASYFYVADRPSR